MRNFALLACALVCAVLLTGCIEEEFSYQLKEKSAGTVDAQIFLFADDDESEQFGEETEVIAQAAKKHNVKFTPLDEHRDDGRWIGHDFSGRIEDMKKLLAELNEQDLSPLVLEAIVESNEYFYGYMDESGKRVLVWDTHSAETEAMAEEYPDSKSMVRMKVEGKLIETNGNVLKDGTVEFLSTSSNPLEFMYATWQVSDKFAANNEEFMRPSPTPTFDISSEVERFRDVVSRDWFSIPVWTMSKKGIITGFEDSTFRPNLAVTRADFLVMTMRAYEIMPDSRDRDNFADVPADKYYAPYLATAKRMGIAGGMGYNEFWPTANISRQDMCVMLYNILKQKNALPESWSDGGAGDGAGARQYESVRDFPDGWKVSPYAQDAMECLYDAAIINGMDGVLSPDGTSTRAQSAQVLYNLMQK